MKEKMLEILHGVRPDLDFEAQTSMVDGKVLDSFDLITIVAEFNENFDIEIDIEDLEPANFNTFAAMMECVQKYMEM